MPTQVPTARLAGSCAGVASRLAPAAPAAPAAGLAVKSRASTWTLPPPQGFRTVIGAVKSSEVDALVSLRGCGAAGELRAGWTAFPGAGFAGGAENERAPRGRA